MQYKACVSQAPACTISKHLLVCGARLTTGPALFFGHCPCQGQAPSSDSCSFIPTYKRGLGTVTQGAPPLTSSPCSRDRSSDLGPSGVPALAPGAPPWRELVGQPLMALGAACRHLRSSGPYTALRNRDLGGACLLPTPTDLAPLLTRAPGRSPEEGMLGGPLLLLPNTLHPQQLLG